MDINNYIENLEKDRKNLIESIRKVIFEIFPDITENMMYKMPTYLVNEKPIFALASQKHYISLYMMNIKILDEFRARLKKYNPGKSCIRFKKISDEEMKVISIILLRLKEHYKL